MGESLTLQDTTIATVAAFGLLNRAFFNNELPVPTFETGVYVQSDGTYLCGVYLRPNEHPDYPNHTILVSPVGALSLVAQGVCETWQIAIVDTLLHEMVHYYDSINGVVDTDENGYHNEAFRDAATRHGLDCEHREESGWAATGISLLGWLTIDDEITDNEADTLDLWDFI